MDKNSNGEIDIEETIYHENDTTTVGTDTFGDRLTALTVRNNGTLPDDEIAEITLLANGTAIANATTPTNGTWVLNPDPETAWFGPSGNGTSFSVRTTLAENATGGETVSLRVPPVQDSGTEGVYDPGDTGMFFQQDSPTGDLGPGPTLTVETDSAGGGGSDTVDPEPVDIEVSLDATNLTTDAEAIPVSVDTNGSDVDLRVELRRAVNNSTVATRSVRVGDNGSASVSFEPRPGRFRVRVAEPESESVGLSRPFEVRRRPVVSFENGSYAVPRGEVIDLGVRFERAANATLRLRGPTGETMATVQIAKPDGGHRASVELDTYAAGRGPPETGIRTPGPPDLANSSGPPPKPNESGGGGGGGEGGETTESPTSMRSEGLSENSSAPEVPAETATGERRNRTAGHPNATGRTPGPAVAALGAGTYNLSLEYDGTVADNATLQVTEEWSGSVEPMVVPAGVNVSEVGRIEDVATPRREIAVGDTLVLAIETRGLGEYTRNVTPAPGETHRRPPNSTPGPREEAFVGLRTRGKTSNGTGGFPAEHLRRIGEDAPGRIVFATRTAVNGTDLVRSGERYGAALTLTEASPFVPGGGTTDSFEQESVEANLSVVPARANLSAVGASETFDVKPVPNVSVTGNTTVAPGTVATVHLNGTADGEPFEEASETTVEEDGTYDTTLNLSEADPGTAYTVSVSANDERISPLRTGSVLETAAEAHQAAGGTGGGSGYGDRDDEAGGPNTPRTTTGLPTTTPTTSGDGPHIEYERIEDLGRTVWNRVPEPLRIGLEAIVLALLGLLALLMVLRGTRRLL